MTLTKQQKRFFKKAFTQMQATPEQLLRIPLIEGRRTLYADDRRYDYGFHKFDEDWTDLDIEEWLDENVRIRIPSHVYWDCSGYSFTAWISWHRNPNGFVSIVHAIDRDW